MKPLYDKIPFNAWTFGGSLVGLGLAMISGNPVGVSLGLSMFCAIALGVEIGLELSRRERPDLRKR